MKRFAEKLRRVEKNLVAKRGEFYFFALLRQEDARLYELIFAADWADRLPIIRAIGLVVDEIRSTLGERALIYFTRVFPYPVKTPGLREIYRDFPVEHDLVEIHNEVLLGLSIEEGYLLTARAKLPKEGGLAAR